MDAVDSTVQGLRRLGASIGEEVFLGDDIFVELQWARLLTIEDGVVIGRESAFILHDSSLTNVANFPSKVGRITLRKECYLGHYVIVLPGVEIGHHAIVGTGSVVTKDVPPETVVAGVPARHLYTIEELKQRHREDMENPESRFRYWDIPAWRSHLGRLSPEEHQAELEKFISTFDA